MKNSLINLVKISLIVLITYYIFKEINFSKLVHVIAEYSISWSIIAMLSVILSDLCLAYRWKFLTNNKCSLLASFESIVISGFLNFILPAKLGELSKLIYLKKIYQYNINNSLSILLIERICDVFILAILTLVASTFFIEHVQATYYALSIISIIFFLLGILNTKLFVFFVKKLPIKYLRVYILKIRNNILNKYSMKDFVILIIYSFIVWCSYFLTVYIFLIHIAEFNLSIMQVLVVFIISSIAMSIPIMPGGVGTYQASIIFALGLYNIPKEEALIAGIIIHLILLFPSFLAAIIVIENKGLSIATLKKVKI